MANHFVDQTSGDNANAGHDLDNCWQTVEYALESGSLAANDIVWVKRAGSEIPTSDIACAYDGTPAQPIQIIGCPRDHHHITSSDWTNGSDTVTVDDANMVRESHQARYITGPNGKRYFIERVISTTSIQIDREYVGTTSLNDATAIILADEDYATFAAIDDSAWTVKIASWVDDADTLPLITFDGGNFEIVISTDNDHQFKNMDFQDSSDAFGIVSALGPYSSFTNCMFKQIDTNTLLLGVTSHCVLTACTLEGSHAAATGGTAQSGVSGSSSLILNDVAIYNCGGYAFSSCGMVIMNNVSIGWGLHNGLSEIYQNNTYLMTGIDVRIDGTNGYLTSGSTYSVPTEMPRLAIENYGKVLGVHKSFYGNNGTLQAESVTAGTGTPVPDQRAGGAVKLLRIMPNWNYLPSRKYYKQQIPLGEFELTAGAKTITAYVQSLIALTAAEFFLGAQFVDTYDDTTEYTQEIDTSTETITARSAITDWANYLQVSVNPATTSKVRLTLFISVYNATATNYIYVDPKVVIA